MRATSTGKCVAFTCFRRENSGKSADEIVGLGDANPTFGDLATYDFASHVASGEITEGDELLEYNIYMIRALILVM